MTPSCLEECAPTWSFQQSNVPVDFFKFLSTEFAACSNCHQAKITIVKRRIQGRNYVIRVRVEPRSCDQGRRKYDVFTLTAGTLLTPLSFR